MAASFEEVLDTVQYATQRASGAVAVALPREARGDVAGALVQIEAAEAAVRFALAGLATAKAMLAERAQLSE